MVNLDKVNFQNIKGYCDVKQPKADVSDTKPSSDFTMNSNYSKAMHAIGTSLVNSDKDTLQGILKYGSAIREKSGKITLDRNPLWDCDIPYQKNNYYRMIGDGGYNDIVENGVIRPKQDTKANYECSYFEKGRANAIYAKRGGANYILELPDCKQLIKKEASYPAMYEVKSGEVPHRIWHLTDDKHYEIVYDSINDVISRHPDFRYK